jgi:hypothetical protein
MKIASVEIDDKVDQLLAILQNDIEHLQKTLARLNELRSLVIKRDDTALSKLLESIHADSDTYKAAELKRQMIRKELSRALGCSLQQLTLSALEAVLPDEKKNRIALIKAKLKLLIKELKKEHISTTLLLSECARFNSLLLKSIFALGKTGTLTYSSSGATKQQADLAFLNLQL